MNSTFSFPLPFPLPQESDIEVMIGTAPCNVTSPSRNQLTRRPPASQPKAWGPKPDDALEMVVVVGQRLRYAIGKLSYVVLNDGQGQPLLSVIIAITIGKATLVTQNSNATLIELCYRIGIVDFHRDLPASKGNMFIKHLSRRAS